MRRRARISLVLVAVPLLLAAQCSLMGPDEADDLEEARERWAVAGIDDYSFVLRRSCFCGGGVEPVRIVVRDGVATSFTVVETGEPLPEMWREVYPTIDGLFDVINEAIERADEIDVAYDRATGHPLTIDIDYAENAIDDEMHYDITGFERN